MLSSLPLRYDRSNWNHSNPISRALSSANVLFNGNCHNAIVSGGYSPAIAPPTRG
ncbi:MAG: hypothetical protein M9928_14510 [Anaerolineae bacterium]|nr:hypothetical protein [Anaerolineae bacterium]